MGIIQWTNSRKIYIIFCYVPLHCLPRMRGTLGVLSYYCYCNGVLMTSWMFGTMWHSVWYITLKVLIWSLYIHCNIAPDWTRQFKNIYVLKLYLSCHVISYCVMSCHSISWMCYVVLCSAVLWCAVLCCTVLCYVALRYFCFWPLIGEHLVLIRSE